MSSTIQLISDTTSIQADAVACLWEATRNVKSIEDYQPLVQVINFIFRCSSILKIDHVVVVKYRNILWCLLAGMLLVRGRIWRLPT